MKNSEAIVDENGIEILVGYNVEKDSHVEEGHGLHTITDTDVTLTSVEVVIKGTGIDILPMLNERQIDFIISKLEEV